MNGISFTVASQSFQRSTVANGTAVLSLASAWAVFFCLPPLPGDTTFSLSKAQISWVPCYSSYSTCSTSTVPSMYMATSCYRLLFTFWKRMHTCVAEVSSFHSCLGSLCLMKCLNLPGRHRSHQLSVSNIWANALPPSPLSMISHHWHLPRTHWPQLANCLVAECVTGNESSKQPDRMDPIRPNIEPTKGTLRWQNKVTQMFPFPKIHNVMVSRMLGKIIMFPYRFLLYFGARVYHHRQEDFAPENLGQKKLPFCRYFVCCQMAGMTLSSGASHSKQTKGLLRFLSFK